MTDGKIIDGALALVFAVAAVAGASGACLIVAHRVMRGRNLTMLMVLAYIVVGANISVATIAFRLAFMSTTLSFSEIVLAGLVAGAVGSVTLAATNLSVRLVARRLGLEVDVNVQVKRDEP